jgi:hypothetical protein
MTGGVLVGSVGDDVGSVGDDVGSVGIVEGSVGSEDGEEVGSDDGPSAVRLGAVEASVRLGVVEGSVGPADCVGTDGTPESPATGEREWPLRSAGDRSPLPAGRDEAPGVVDNRGGEPISAALWPPNWVAV